MKFCLASIWERTASIQLVFVMKHAKKENDIVRLKKKSEYFKHFPTHLRSDNDIYEHQKGKIFEMVQKVL